MGGSAQAQSFEQDLQQWDIVTLRTPLSPDKKWQGYLEVQPRMDLLNKNDQGYMAALLIRPAIGYQLNRHVSVWQGYAWTPTYQPTFRNEHRIFQQLLLENKIKKLTLINRTRLEERFIENAGGTAVRGRHLLRFAYPLDKRQQWSAVIYDEAFVNFNSPPRGPQSGFDQNRAFAGLNRKLGKHANLEAGYMAQYVNRADPLPDRLNHIILLNLNFTFQ